jgi:hypothetical protein
LKLPWGVGPFFTYFMFKMSCKENDNVYSPQNLQNKVVKDFIMPKLLKKKTKLLILEPKVVTQQY